MNMKVFNKRIFTILIALMCSWVLLGCGEDPALETYKQNMEVYFQGAATLNDRINSIDAQSDVNGEKLLGYLDQLDTITAQMAELEVPEQFQLVESLADEASENMTQAVSLYHELFTSEIYNQSLADGAFEYYERANKRISYIRSILQGNIPDELQIVEDTEDTGSTGIPVDVTNDNSEEDSNQFFGASDEEDSDDDYYEYEDDSSGLEYLDVEDE